MADKVVEMVKKFAPQNFNDLLATGAIIIIPALWVLQGLKVVDLPPEVTGALIVTWSLIVQFYFRKAQGGE
jgi:hypothetical protein